MQMNCKMLTALIIFFCAGLIYPQDSINVVSNITEEDIEINYLVGVNTENLGLKVSAAYYLGERKSQKAVIPLMDMLHSESAPEARIMAALSLYKIGDERGIFAIKRAIEYDENEQVKKMCGILYQMYEVEKNKVK